ncbi:hypothetical protein JCM18916_764 [Cutibacterium acnes JCM 18916]|nr:hypothetical protein JCM18916_764 [Cutibacterium acnes JCM 18916]
MVQPEDDCDDYHRDDDNACGDADDPAALLGRFLSFLLGAQGGPFRGGRSCLFLSAIG